MAAVLNWLTQHQSEMLAALKEIVAIPGVSPGGGHEADLKKTAAWVKAALDQAGMTRVQLFPGEERRLNGRPDADIVYAERLVDKKLPTVLFYSHYDVQPVDPKGWTKTTPFDLKIDGSKAFGRGAVDDKGGLVAQLAVFRAFEAAGQAPPANIKVIIEGLEEVGSPFLESFIQDNREMLAADAMVVTDTDNHQPGRPALTYSLRGCLTLSVTVRSAAFPSHSGTTGGGLADSAAALCLLLARLFPGSTSGESIAGLYEDVRAVTPAERAMLEKLEAQPAEIRQRFGVGKKVELASAKGSFLLSTTRLPAVTIIGLSAGSVTSPSNQVLSEAKAVVSVRLVADQKPEQVTDAVRRALVRDVPWGVEVTVEAERGGVPAWMAEPTGEVFTAAMQALETGYAQPAVYLGCGGTIGYVGPAARILNCVPILMGISGGNLHSHDEFLDLPDWLRLQQSIVAFLENLAASKKR